MPTGHLRPTSTTTSPARRGVQLTTPSPSTRGGRPLEGPSFARSGSDRGGTRARWVKSSPDRHRRAPDQAGRRMGVREGGPAKLTLASHAHPGLALVEGLEALGLAIHGKAGALGSCSPIWRRVTPGSRIRLRERSGRATIQHAAVERERVEAARTAFALPRGRRRSGARRIGTMIVRLLARVDVASRTRTRTSGCCARRSSMGSPPGGFLATTGSSCSAGAGRRGGVRHAHALRFARCGSRVPGRRTKTAVVPPAPERYCSGSTRARPITKYGRAPWTGRYGTGTHDGFRHTSPRCPCVPRPVPPCSGCRSPRRQSRKRRSRATPSSRHTQGQRPPPADPERRQSHRVPCCPRRSRKARRTRSARACAGQPEARRPLASSRPSSAPENPPSRAGGAARAGAAARRGSALRRVLRPRPRQRGPLRFVADRLIRQDPVTTVSPVPCSALDGTSTSTGPSAGPSPGTRSAGTCGGAPGLDAASPTAAPRWSVAGPSGSTLGAAKGAYPKACPLSLAGTRTGAPPSPESTTSSGLLFRRGARAGRGTSVTLFNISPCVNGFARKYTPRSLRPCCANTCAGWPTCRAAGAMATAPGSAGPTPRRRPAASPRPESRGWNVAVRHVQHGSSLVGACGLEDAVPFFAQDAVGERAGECARRPRPGWWCQVRGTGKPLSPSGVDDGSRGGDGPPK